MLPAPSTTTWQKPWSRASLKQFGLQDVRRQYFDLEPQWFPTSSEFSVAAAGKSVRLETARPATGSPATPAGGLDLEPVWVGLGTASDFAGRDVKGKLVVIQDDADARRRRAFGGLQRLGAARRG